ncbi:MAG: sigma 54-interacting transcriptional regulator [Deltaproteobacteria bacterium]|nr:sigma 54-interacting transcriptional regulator [Deltaproteobacteria bacterium]
MKPLKPVNVAIVGGGPGCKAIMNMIFAERLSQLRMKLIGVACTNSRAIGYRYAQEQGIYTTRDYRDFFKLKDLNMIIELTGRDAVANEISQNKPEHVRLMDYVAAQLFWDVFQIEEERIAERKQAEKALTKARDELEGRVKERTAKLAKTTEQLRLELGERKKAEGALRQSEEALRTINVELAQGLSEVFGALNEISSGNPEVRIPETSKIDLIAKLKHIVNLTARDLGEIVDLSHEFAIGLAEHFDVLHRVSRGDLKARVSGSSNIELLEFLKKMTNETIESVSSEITERKRVEVMLEQMFQTVKKGHDDLLSILNMLRLGIATVDRGGRISFLNQTAQQLIEKSGMAVLGKHWQEVFLFDGQDKAKLEDMLKYPSKERPKLQAQVKFHEGRRYWMDIEVREDPRNPQKEILFLYDMSEIYDLRRMLEGKVRFHDLVGKTEGMQNIYKQIREASKVDWTALIEGQTGTGKELVARAIHFSSHRKEKPFVAVNCAGLNDSLLTSELFGHKRGAFTGAVEDHKGFFEVANGGTLLLDEIGDISRNMQTSLLRVLEEKKITRLGESTARQIDVRVLASTHRNLTEEVASGRFRPDLLYRIRIARITLPPLRERREDIPLLVETFLSQSRAATGKAVKHVSREAMRILLEYDWPGNVRELKSAIDFATLHCKPSVISAEDLPPEILHSKRSRSSTIDPHQNEKQRMVAALEAAKGNRTVAAREMGISRATLYRRLTNLHIDPSEIPITVSRET